MNTLPFEKIIGETKNNKLFSQNYLQELYNYNMEALLPIKSNSPLTSIKCFYPLPSRLLLTEIYTNNDKIIKNKNEYHFHGIPGNRIIFADKKLPFISDKLKYPIPFSFPVPNQNEIEILTSNVYYYEVKILDKQNLSAWLGECVSIGFGNKNTHLNTHVGWTNDSIGFHSDDGTIRYNESSQVFKTYSDIWVPGDIAGAGIIYVGKNEIIPFFTFNGKLVYIGNKSVKIDFPYFPIIGYDHSQSIEINFSSKPFKYDIKTLIYKNSDNIISSENTFIIDYDIGNILNEPPISDNPALKIPSNNINLYGIDSVTGQSTFFGTIQENNLPKLVLNNINHTNTSSFITDIFPLNTTNLNDGLNFIGFLNLNSTPINSLINTQLDTEPDNEPDN